MVLTTVVTFQFWFAVARFACVLVRVCARCVSPLVVGTARLLRYGYLVLRTVTHRLRIAGSRLPFRCLRCLVILVARLLLLRTRFTARFTCRGSWVRFCCATARLRCLPTHTYRLGWLRAVTRLHAWFGYTRLVVQFCHTRSVLLPDIHLHPFTTTVLPHCATPFAVTPFACCLPFYLCCYWLPRLRFTLRTVTVAYAFTG